MDSPGTERVDTEPEDGWVTGPDLIDTEVMVTTLCRFSGQPVSHDDPCPVRQTLQHPDVECRTLFFQSDALRGGLINFGGFDNVPEEIRKPWQGGAPIATQHAERVP